MLRWLSHFYAACRPKVMFVGPNNSKTKQKVFTLNQLLLLKHELLVKSKEQLLSYVSLIYNFLSHNSPSTVKQGTAAHTCNYHRRTTSLQW